MTFYASALATANRLLSQYGAPGTLTRTATTYTPATGATTNIDTEQAVFAAVLPIGDKFVDGTNILATDRRALIGAAGVSEPKPGDVLTWGDESLNVVRVKSLAPARTAVLFDCVVRG
jgi:hypothetical protein